MKTIYFILLFVAFTSCTYRPFPSERYTIDEGFRRLFSMYSVGDTLVFKSSENAVDSFAITSIDSTLNDRNGYLMNARNEKSISVKYRQIPVDKWQDKWIEGRGDGKIHEHSEDGTFLSVVKFPDDQTTEYYFDFKRSGCFKGDVPKPSTDTVAIGGLIITNYYKIDNCRDVSQDQKAIKVLYSTLERGLIAFETNDGVIWTRQD